MSISIITVVRNGEEHIRLCFDKIYELRTSIDFEYIVVDGNSTDSTVQICNEYGISVITQDGSGIYNAMNQGVKEASNDFILFVNADDFIEPEGLRNVISILESEPNLNHFFSVRLFSETSGCSVWNPIKTISRTFSMPAPHPGMIIKRNLLLDELKFSENIKSGSDYDMALRLIKRGDFKCHDIIISNFRLGGTSSHFSSILENSSIRYNNGVFFISRYIGFCYDFYQYIRFRFL